MTEELNPKDGFQRSYPSRVREGNMVFCRSDDYLVRVKAQVMTRDDSTGGWVPMGGGGMSVVGLKKSIVSHGDDIRHEYHIHGEKLADKNVVLKCTLRKDVQYTKANPTFHHWKTEEKRFGLTFQSSADARAFDKGVKRAVEHLLEGSPDSNLNGDLDVGDDDVFMTLDLPLGRRESSSPSTTSTTTSSPTPQSPALSSIPDPNSNQFTHINVNTNHHFQTPPHQHLHRVTYISKHPRQTSPQSSEKSSTKSKSSSDSMQQDLWITTNKGSDKNGSSQRIKGDQGSSTTDENIDIVDYSYVQFAKNRPMGHEYSYPTLESINKPQPRRDSISSVKKHNLEVLASQPPLPTKSKKKRKDRTKKDKKQNRLLSQRSRCVYCHEMFVHDDNQRGNCEDAPDKVEECIGKVSCICCARGMLYHCMADADGDYGHPCICDTNDENNCKKWTALTILSFFVPCLWCYWPMTGCHRCGVACGCCGGRHKAA